MKTTATTIAAAIAAFLIGLSCSRTNTVYSPELEMAVLEKITAERDSLQYAFDKSESQSAIYKSQRDELQAARVDDLTKLGSLTVQLAELQKARQRPEALPVATPACAEVPANYAAVPSAVPYQRRGLFGRIRNR